MRCYVGQTRSAKLIARLLDLGFGEMTCRGELMPRRAPWAYDNGAFGDWKAGRAFDEDKFESDAARMAQLPESERPAFVVVPDIVAGGLESLEFSARWTVALKGLAPRYLAVQDGMTPQDVAMVLEDFEGVFVGGTLAWKVRTGAEWVDFAHRHARPCHIGRVGTELRVRWARRIGADSVDSCLPLWSDENLARFINGLSESPQATLPESDGRWTPPAEFWRAWGVPV